jgi:hypothetical protein
MNCRKGDVKFLLIIALLSASGAWSALCAQTAAPEAAPASDTTGGATATMAEEGATATGADGVVIYEREVFQYTAGGRPDPFRSLLLEGELGVRPEDLTLRGVLIDPVATRSVAILSQTGSERRIQLRVGERIGPIRILSIEPDRVEIVAEELGVSRRETLRLVRPQPGARP